MPDSVFDSPEWFELARCLGTGCSTFFSVAPPNAFRKKMSTRRNVTRKMKLALEVEAIAKEVCSQCTVREECLEYAIEERIDDGVWGGMSWRERRAEVKRRRADGTLSA